MNSKEFEAVKNSFKEMDLLQHQTALFTLLGGLYAVIDHPKQPSKKNIKKMIKNASDSASRI
ncbi:hypothetical protein [Terribacillus saccharophilus]|uniref:hypothetical protein n=1 Tax=Terribacillus saccharophilus TaxID=361277 RepID=UPI00298A07D0|nr:hypothetical protein [Terribacillus saccharophilus]MCM3227526.1 hypothetical protein [Terribacillus saccharophilus]